jgi:hypothetical protein
LNQGSMIFSLLNQYMVSSSHSAITAQVKRDG